MAPALSVWYKDSPPAATLEVYYAALAYLSYPLFCAAVLEVIGSPQYGFPKPSDFQAGAVRAIMAQGGRSESWARQELEEARADFLARYELEPGTLKLLERPHTCPESGAG